MTNKEETKTPSTNKRRYSVFIAEAFKALKEKIPYEKTKLPVLVVDDEPGMRETLHDILDDEGYEVTSVGTCKEAIEQGTKGKYDVAVIDILLPDGSGIDVAEQLKKDKPWLPIILITGYMEGLPDEKKMSDYTCLYKPFELEDLIAAIKKECEKRADKEQKG